MSIVRNLPRNTGNIRGIVCNIRSYFAIATGGSKRQLSVVIGKDDRTAVQLPHDNSHACSSFPEDFWKYSNILCLIQRPRRKFMSDFPQFVNFNWSPDHLCRRIRINNPCFFFHLLKPVKHGIPFTVRHRRCGTVVISRRCLIQCFD